MSVVELPKELEERARALHREAFVYDACLPGGGIFRDEKPEIEALLEGQVDGANLTVADCKDDFLVAVGRIQQLKELVERHSDKVSLCVSTAELKEAEKQGKLGLIIHFQDSKPIEDNLNYLRTFHDLGLRVFQLTYNIQGYVGTGCCERHDAGLSYFGLEVVAECNRLGILIDLSHCCHATTRDAIQHSKAPVAFTHVGVYTLCPAHGRNKPDDLLKAVVETGGVVGITWFPSLVKRNPATQEVLESDVEDVLDQIDYAVKLLGVENVGLGSDLSNYHAKTLEVPATSAIRWYRPMRPDVYGVGPVDRYDPYPKGLDSHSKLLNLTRGLVRRGYEDEDIKKIMGGNWMRLCKAVWKA